MFPLGYGWLICAHLQFTGVLRACMYTGAVLSYILKGRGSLAKHINKPVVSVYISLCMWLLSYRDHFKVFNASVQYFQMVRPLLQPGLCIHVVPSLRQVVQSLEEVDNQDRSWRAELMMQVLKATMLPYCSFINKSRLKFTRSYMFSP